MAEKQDTAASRKIKSLVGEKFGRLTVTGTAGRIGKAHSFSWNCVCECGKECVVREDSLKSGNTKSCGCIVGPGNTKHGLHRTVEYKTWWGMIGRCHNQNAPHFKNYGGRGITVCEKWRKSFELFLMDIGQRPSDKHSIDRINNDGNYEPGNCRWATRLEQGSNRRSNQNMTIGDETHHIAEWSRIYGINRTTLSYRLQVQGMSLKEALRKPVKTASHLCE